jgi:hypothetical protein
MDKLEQSKALCRSIERALNEPDGHTLARGLILIAARAVPMLGSVVDVANLFLDKDEKNRANDLIALQLRFMQLTNEQLETLHAYFEDRIPTRTKLWLLLSEVLGSNGDALDLLKTDRHIAVMLSDLTREDFKVYEAIGWIAVHCCGSIATMGQNNQVGTFIEEQKRPYGFGTGYTLELLADLG